MEMGGKRDRKMAKFLGLNSKTLQFLNNNSFKCLFLEFVPPNVLLERFKILYKVNANPYITIGIHELKRLVFLAEQILFKILFYQSAFDLICAYFKRNVFVCCVVIISKANLRQVLELLLNIMLCP